MLIEAGPEVSWPELTRGLQELGVAPADLAALLITHIHLDHAGGAWRLAELGVPIYVHEFGMKHLVDPSKLHASARRIYGDDLESLWGRTEPCPESSVHPVTDGDIVQVAGLKLRAVDTPGHAKHHHAWSLEGIEPATVFTGDAAAMLIPETDWISIPMPPPELDLQAWQVSIDRLDGGTWTRLCLTHGGTVEGDAVDNHLERLRVGLRSHVDFIEPLLATHPDDAKKQSFYRAWLLESALAAGIEEAQFDQYVTPGLLTMNLNGVARYLDQSVGSPDRR